MQTRLLSLMILALTVAPPFGALNADPASQPAYVAYYWRAKPGQNAAYDDYIRTIAEPIDADARRAGAFEEVHAVTPAPGTNADWSHLRIFRVRDLDAAKTLGDALDAATKRMVPNDAKRKANSERAATLREFVRQEIWMERK